MVLHLMLAIHGLGVHEEEQEETKMVLPWRTYSVLMCASFIGERELVGSFFLFPLLALVDSELWHLCILS